MTIQTIWTALPVAYDASYYYFSVFVSHRLSGAPAPSTLLDYPLGPASAPTNWALSMQTLVLDVSFDGGTTYQPAQQIPSGQPHFWASLSPGIWSNVFPSGTAVDSYVPQSPSTLALRTFRAVQLAQGYESLYGQVVQTSATDHPPVSAPGITDLVQSVGHFNDPMLAAGTAAGGGLWATLRATFPPRGDGPPANDRTYSGWLQQNIAGHFGNLSPAAQQLAVQHYLAWRFYRRDVSSQYGPRNPALVEAPAVPQPEFHKLVGMLANHPTLLRMLGFAFDFRTAAATPNGSPLPSQGLLQVRAQYRSTTSTDLRFPQTLYETTSTGFFARAKASSDHLDGMLIPRGYSIVQVDVDGHAQKMIGYAATAARAAGTSQNATESLPARRSGGLTFMQDDRVTQSVIPALTQVDTLNQTLAANNPATPVQVDVTDVTRGYRVDVWDGSGVWKSLCRRGGVDLVGTDVRVPLGAADVEGIVSALGGTQGAPDADPAEQNTLYVHEALFGWDGWSLCAQRPGRALGQKDGDPNQVPILGFLANHAPAGYTVTSQYKATQRSLPRLRYGSTYRFRVRLVDLAGNSLPYTNEANVVNPVTSSAAATFWRYEPVAPPTLVLRRVPTLGESLETIVIRSNPDPVSDLAQIVPGNNATTYSATADAMSAGFLPICERHMVAPKTSQIVAETHGMLDGLTALTAFNISAKEAGTLTSSTVYNIDTGTMDPLPAGELVFAYSDGRSPPPPPPANPGDPLPSGTLVLHSLDQVTVPYLPDPLAHGVTVQFPAPGPQVVPPLDASLANVTVAPWVFDTGGWPRVHSMRLIVDESTTPNVTYAWSADGITVGLPPATLTTLRYSSTPDATQVLKTAVWNEIGTNAAGQSAATAGTNWLLSPYRNLQLVHAVQRPLLIPSFAQAALSRDVGQTFANMMGTIQVDGRSTVHVDVNATWVDPYDAPNDKTGPHTYAFSDPTGMSDPFTGHRGRAFELPVQYTDTALEFGFSVVATIPMRHEFGDTKHRWVVYSPDATTRYREYFPPDVTANAANITTKGKTQILNVLSSKRPDPLEVLYAVPTFKWQTSPDGNTVTRVGRGIRVYLARPWFLTGVDEMVGVCLQPSTTMDPSLARYASEWGRDPIWTSAGVPEPLQPEHFTNRVMTMPEPPEFEPNPPVWSTGPFALAEDNTLSVSVIGFFPEYNSARQLWYVDIEMDSGTSYFPFVRLALARFQPHSVWPTTPQSQHLSRVTRTEFLQLVPDRVASVTYAAGGLLVITVSGVGAFDVLPGTQTPALGHKITARVQQRPAGSGNDLLWTSLGNEIELGLDAIEPAQATWLGRMFLPAVSPDQKATQEFRLLVKETEAYPADGDVADGTTGNVGFAERLVYASAIALTV